MDRIVKELGTMSQKISGFALRKERALFDKLAPEDGKVCLDHLITYMHKSENQAELDNLGISNLGNQCHTVSRSLLVLYHFDKNHEGKIAFEEFLDVLNYFRELDKRKKLEASSSEKSGKTGNDWFKKILPPSWSSSSSIKPPEFPGSAALGLADQEKTVHGHTLSSLTCKVLHRSDSDCSSKFASASSPSDVPPVMQTMQVELDTVTSASSVSHTEDEEARKMLLNDLTRKGGRKEFANWLFKVADVNHRHTFVTRAEILALLHSIVDDGISPEALRVSLEVDDGMNREEVASAADTKSTHDSASDSSDSESDARLTDLEVNRLLDAVMRQFDLSQSGRVTREDFMALANMIEAEYESLNTDLGARRVGDYVLARILGSGSEGVVRLAVHRKHGTLHAVKIINKRGQLQSRLNREVAANLKLKHKCIVEVQEVIENRDFMFIIMEYVNGGSLDSYVSKKKPLDERVARKYAADLVDAFVTVHQQGVCHRDLRIENLLLDSKSELKIADFGHAGLFKGGYDIFSTMAVGSTSHMAPEQLEGANYSGEKLDVWSFAIILHFFLAGYNPFESNRTIQESLQNIKNADLSHLSPTLSPDARDLITKCLSRDFNERPSWEEISRVSLFDSSLLAPSTCNSFFCGFSDFL
jgi:Ca2+-binding EF-hand superfamily protein/predicted Ser/Thr protein kinase